MKIAERVFEGQLARIDADAKTFYVTEAAGLAMVFNYDDETEFLGADKSIQGPAEKATGRHVKLSYADYAGKYIATKIEIIEKSA